MLSLVCRHLLNSTGLAGEGRPPAEMPMDTTNHGDDGDDGDGNGNYG
jgi:hypothetical protein